MQLQAHSNNRNYEAGLGARPRLPESTATLRRRDAPDDQLGR